MPHTQTTKGYIAKQVTEYIVKQIKNNWKNVVWMTSISIIILFGFHLLTGLPLLTNSQGNLDPRAITFSGGFSTIVIFGIIFCREKKLPLFHTILVWVFLGLFAYTILSAMWSSDNWPDRLFSGWHTIEGDRLDQVKTTLTTIGGIGGVGYLVIKYRERSASEQGEANDKLLSAVQQLGDDSPQVRIAGVYALADVADTYGGPYPQRVVDVLCGYLRTHRTNSSYDRTKQPTKADENKRSMRYFINVDRAVESTILFTLANHLKSAANKADSTKNHPGPWSHCNIDLSGARLTEFVDFSGTTIKKISCQEVRFERTPSFHGATFTDEATFREAIFLQNTSFRNTTFQQYATFRGSIFKKYANFGDATFIKDASFRGATFGQAATFRCCTFMQQAHYIGTTFKNDAKFVRATFTLNGNFYNATFAQHAHFHGATFGKASLFQKATFKQNVTFLDIATKKQAKFIFRQAKFNPNYRKRIRFPSSFTLIDGIPKEAEWESDNEVFSPDAFMEGESDQGCGGDGGDDCGAESDVS